MIEIQSLKDLECQFLEKSKKFIKDNDNILLVRSYKGENIILMYKAEYKEEINVLLDDSNT